MDTLLRKLSPFKGKARLARIVLKNAISQRENVLIKGKYNCFYKLPNLRETISFELFINGIYEQGTSNFFRKWIPPNGVFLDLGANIGAISIPLAVQRQDIRIICVEAAPWLFSFLEENIKQNNITNINSVNKALFSKDEEELNFYSPREKFGKGSLSPVFTDEGVKVKTMTLDTLVEQQNIAKVDFIKVDVEGYEYHVFNGAKQLLQSEHPPVIFFEFEDWAEEQAGLEIGSAQSILMSYGFKLYSAEKDGRFRFQPKPLLKGSKMLLASKVNQRFM
ncbi:MAG: FkbM family methyltransferase [Chitinophagaceae bacterium]|nr:FkbM family methyltransferase [Chitinophagaceae bacterium]